MSDLKASGKDFFSRGIERIFTRQSEEASHLPELPALPPAEGPVRSSLSQLLSAPLFDDEIEAILQPQVDDKNLLRPGPYSRALSQARALLERRRNTQGGTSLDSEVLALAIQTLEEEETLRDLAFRYRVALFAA